MEGVSGSVGGGNGAAAEGRLPIGKIRTEFLAGPEENRAVDLRRELSLTVAGDRLSQLEELPERPAEAGWYRRDAAEILAEIAGWSYSDGQTLVDELQNLGIVEPGASCFEVSVRNDAMLVVATAFYIQSGGVGVLSFRGTEPSNAINFLTDATVDVMDFKSMGHVHGGFYRNLRAVWTDVAKRLSAAIGAGDGDRRLHALYITGHSLGAAMAVLAAATIFGDDRFAAWQPLVRGIYTYGQPMVGDKAFAASCDERFGRLLFRHVYARDLVPRMPPRTAGRFQHSGKEYVGSSITGWTPRAKPVAQAVTAIASIPLGAAAWAFKQIPMLHWIRVPFSIDDHSPNSYLEAFRAARE